MSKDFQVVKGFPDQWEAIEDKVFFEQKSSHYHKDTDIVGSLHKTVEGEGRLKRIMGLSPLKYIHLRISHLYHEPTQIDRCLQGVPGPMGHAGGKGGGPLPAG